MGLASNILSVALLSIVFPASPLFGDVITKRCLYSGCRLSSGLYPEDLDLYINNLLLDADYKDNALRFLSWDVGQNEGSGDRKNIDYRRDNICEMVSNVQPSIIGLQDIDESTLDYIQPCLSEYMNLDSGRTNEQKTFNRLFIKRLRRLRTVKSGRFWLSKTPDSPETVLAGTNTSQTCVWSRMRFLERRSVKYSMLFQSSKRRVNERILKLLMAFTSKEYKPNESVGREKPAKYQWFDFYVAVTKLDQTNETAAKQQLQILTKHLQNNVMGWRRYPIIIMGDFGWEYNSIVFDHIKRSGRMQNTFTSSFGQYPAKSFFKQNDVEDGKLVDFIFETKFNGVLAATITPNKDRFYQFFDHRPLVSVVMRGKN